MMRRIQFRYENEQRTLMMVDAAAEKVSVLPKNEDDVRI
jgi:hypothetical protein